MSLSGALALRTQLAASGLDHALHELVVRQIDIEEFIARFLDSRSYALHPVRPGLFVTPSRRW